VTIKLYPIVFIVLLAGCGGGDVRGNEAGNVAGFSQDERPLGKTMVYECVGYDFVARLGPGEMAVWLQDRYTILSQVRSASGVRYEEGDTVFWTKGEEAMLQVGNQRFTECRLVPGRVPWEDARRRGVEFRAVGNEPDWYLEIQPGRHVLFVGGNGMQRVLVPEPGEVTLGSTRIYHAITETNDLRVEIVDELCSDTMKGNTFPSQVTVDLNGTTLWGCGRSLSNPWQ
jgi:membrane-bound inhibitor of C-type lysozyme/uncharacterized membrane protein